MLHFLHVYNKSLQKMPSLQSAILITKPFSLLDYVELMNSLLPLIVQK